MTTPASSPELSPIEKIPEYVIVTIFRYYEDLWRRARAAPFELIVCIASLCIAIALTLGDALIIYKSLALAMPEEAVANEAIAATQQSKAPPFLYVWLILFGGFASGYLILRPYDKLRKILRAIFLVPALVLLFALGVVAAASYAPSFVEGLIAQRDNGAFLDLNALETAAPPNWFVVTLTDSGGIGLACVLFVLPVLTFVVADVCLSAAEANFNAARVGFASLFEAASGQPQVHEALRKHNALIEHLNAEQQGKPTPELCASEIIDAVSPELAKVQGVLANHTVISPPPHQPVDWRLKTEVLADIVARQSAQLTVEAIAKGIRGNPAPDASEPELLPPGRPSPSLSNGAAMPDETEQDEF